MRLLRSPLTLQQALRKGSRVANAGAHSQGRLRAQDLCSQRQCAVVSGTADAVVLSGNARLSATCCLLRVA